MKVIFNCLPWFLTVVIMISCQPESEVAITSFDNLSTSDLDLNLTNATKITFDEEINDFEAGDIVSEVFCPDGQGPILVNGENPNFQGQNAAMIFDSNNPTGGDPDLGTPNSVCCGGPGISVNGNEPSNDVALNNVLIISEDLDSGDPDDAALMGAKFWLDFSALGSVTLIAMDVVDVDGESNGAFVQLLDGDDNELLKVDLPETGDNGVALIDLGPTSGVVKMHVVLNGSGAIDNICFEKEPGCTHTLGYWKTHGENGPASFDDTWDLLGPLGQDEPFFLSGGTYFDAISTKPQGNAYYILSQQYVAAILSVLSGASTTTEVDDALTDAEDLFNNWTPAQIGALNGGSSLRQQFISLSETLDDYNNGLIGPGHCDKQEETVAD